MLINQYETGLYFPVPHADTVVVHSVRARESCARPPNAEELSITSCALKSLAMNCIGQERRR